MIADARLSAPNKRANSQTLTAALAFEGLPKHSLGLSPFASNLASYGA